MMAVSHRLLCRRFIQLGNFGCRALSDPAGLDEVIYHIDKKSFLSNWMTPSDRMIRQKLPNWSNPSVS